LTLIILFNRNFSCHIILIFTYKDMKSFAIKQEKNVKKRGIMDKIQADFW
jgi:hypothetical protein